MYNQPEHHHTGVRAEDIPKEQLAFCPVSGDPVNKIEAKQSQRVRSYNGENYYFCCNVCLDLFDKNPEAYVTKSEKSEQVTPVNTLTLFEKEHLVDNVWAFRFHPQKPVHWTAGQYMRVELPHANPDKEGTKRWFTISSAPYEAYIQITTRVTKSTFKQALSRLEVGDTLSMIEDSEGHFIWQDSDKPIIFIAGGIGITPYHSILMQRAHDKQPLSVTLIYGNRTDEVVFKELFDRYAAENPEFTVRYVIGEPLTATLLKELQPSLNQSFVYLSGPDPMVDALGAELVSAGLPESQLKKDGFPNYTQVNY
jgi:ferredoxin-NADP reductase/YHS domain-containing protein